MSNSVIVPEGVIRPILLPVCSVNQRLPSGPAVIPMGRLPGVGRWKSLYRLTSGTAPAGAVGALTASPTNSAIATNRRAIASLSMTHPPKLRIAPAAGCVKGKDRPQAETVSPAPGDLPDGHDERSRTHGCCASSPRTPELVMSRVGPGREPRSQPLEAGSDLATSALAEQSAEQRHRSSCEPEGETRGGVAIVEGRVGFRRRGSTDPKEVFRLIHCALPSRDWRSIGPFVS